MTAPALDPADWPKLRPGSLPWLKSWAMVGLASVLPLLFGPRLLIRILAFGRSLPLFWVETDLPLVALTIDDSPDPRSTPRILDVLARHGARATFFVVTSQIEDEGLLRRMVAEGHEIGNHGTIDRPAALLDPAVFRTDVETAQARLSAFGTPRWFRPGGGRATPAMGEALDQAGLSLALADVFAFDTHVTWRRWLRFFVLRTVRPGSIVVLHDRDARGLNTAKLLDALLPALARRGFRVVTLGELVDTAARRDAPEITPSG